MTSKNVDPRQGPALKTGLIDLAIGLCLSLMLLTPSIAEAGPTCCKRKICNLIGTCPINGQQGYVNTPPYLATNCTAAGGSVPGACGPGGFFDRCYSGGCKGTDGMNREGYSNAGCH